MRRIWKYEIPVDDGAHDLWVPSGALPLYVDVQGKVISHVCIWMLVDDEAVRVIRRFAVIGTGHSFDRHGYAEYVGTAKAADGALMWHVVEIMEPMDE